jgi:anti-sigma B factor antagonist
VADGCSTNEISFLFPEKSINRGRPLPAQGMTTGENVPPKFNGGPGFAWYRGCNASRTSRREDLGGEVAGLDGLDDMASVDDHWENGSVLVIRITGEVDMSNVDDLRERIDTMVPVGTDRVVFDLGALEFIDSSGLSLLVEIANGVGHAELRAPSPIVRRVVDLTGLGLVLPTEE